MIALLLILFVVAFASWAYAVFCILQTLRRFKPDVSPWGRKFLHNPMNAVVFNPGVLTHDGAIYRKRAGKALAVFFLA